MALKDDLLSIYKNANLGVAASGDDLVKIDSYTGGSYTAEQAKAATLALLSDTTSVAIMTYQAFTGHAPSAAGLSYLVNSSTSTTDLNDAYYAKFNQENRFINFSINLATGSGEGAASFAALYGNASYKDVVAAAYDKYIGNAAATAAGKDPASAVAALSSDAVVAYLTTYVKNTTGYTTDADIKMAVKAALVGEVLNAAISSGIGNFVKATNAMLTDLSDGTLSTDASGGVDILAAYGAGNAGSSYTLTTGIDTIVGTSGNDTISTSFTTPVGGTAGVNSTVTPLDSIDGGAGDDTLTIIDADTAAAASFAIPGSATIKNVETVNLTTTGLLAFNSTTLAGLTKLNITSASANGGAQTVTVADTTALTATIAGNGGITTTGGTAVTVANAGTGATSVSGNKLTSVSISGGAAASTVDNNTKTTLTTVSLTSVNADTGITGNAVKDVTIGGTTSATRTVTVTNAAAGGHDLAIHAKGTATSAGAATATVVVDNTANTISVDAQAKATLNVNSTSATALTISGAGALTTTLAAAAVASIDASSNSGGVTLSGFGAAVTALKGGSGADTVTVAAALTAGTNILLGAGNDKLLIATGGSIAGSTASKTTVVDGGDGTDTLALEFVGAANIAAFKNFEVFDTVGMSAKTLDLDILASNNTVTGITGSGEFAQAGVADAVVLTNLGAGVGYSQNGAFDTANDTLTLTQKTAGALNVTLNADSTSTGGANNTGLVAIASNATSLTATFDVDSAYTGGANTQTLALTGTKATTVNVVSGGTNATNVLNLTGGAGTGGNDVLTTVTVTGSQALTFGYTAIGASSIATIDASGQTAGGLTAATSVLKDTGTIKLGGGADSVTVTGNSITAATLESISGMNKSTSATDAAAIKLADKVSFDYTGGVGADAVAVVSVAATVAGSYSVSDKGVVTFLGAGPTTLDGAIALANAAAGGTTGNAVIFQYLNDSYIFVEGTTASAASLTNDSVIKLTGTTGVTALVEDGATNKLFLV